ncbi:MAG: hypothetical protein V3V33_12590 [Candidatus Lokiarchaeia archaeon]
MNEYEVYSLILRLIQIIFTGLVIISPYIIWYLSDRKGRITTDISHITMFGFGNNQHLSGIKASILNKGKLPIRISSIQFFNPKTKEALFPLQYNLPNHYRDELPKVLDTGGSAFVFLEYKDFKNTITDLSILKARFSVNGKYKYSKKLKPPYNIEI